MANKTINQHFQRLIRLLELEAEAEKQEALRDMQRYSPAAEASGSTLIKLVIRDEDAGMGGRILLTLGKRNQTLDLPWTRLELAHRSFSPKKAGKAKQTAGELWSAASPKTASRLLFQSGLNPNPNSPLFGSTASATEISHQRMRQGLEKANAAADSRLRTCATFYWGCVPRPSIRWSTRRRLTQP